MTSVVLMEEQHEKLRRVVDEWRSETLDKLRPLHDNPFEASATVDAADVKSDPIHISTESKDSSSLLTLVETDNISLNKFITVLAYDCLEISRLSRQALKSIYTKLLLFGHSCSQEVLLEGEPQKAFARSLPFFMEFSEVVCRLRAVLNNLVRQVDSIYSKETKNNKLCTSFNSIHIPSVFSSFADGLAVFLIVDEIMARNACIKHYSALFMRMLDVVRTEPDKFSMLAENVDRLERMIKQLDEQLHVAIFQQFLQEDLIMNESMQGLKSNKRFLEESNFCLCEGLTDILSRLDTWKELPSDRRHMVGYLGLFIFQSWLTVDPPDKKLGKLITEVLRRLPVVHLNGNIRFVVLDLLLAHVPQPLVSCAPLKDFLREGAAINNNHLIHMDDVLARECQIIKTAIASWIAAFHSSISPMTEFSEVQASLEIRTKQIIQGLMLANRLQNMLRSTIDLHVLYEVPIKKEKLRSLGHIAVLIKAVENVFYRKYFEISQSLSHMINLVQSHIENLLQPVKTQLELDLSRKAKTNNMTFLSSLTRSGKESDSKMLDSVASVGLALKMLQGGGSNKSQVVLHLAVDVVNGTELQSSENSHLREFFLLVPALTMNATEAMLQGRDKLFKRGRDAENEQFTDDGFVLGLACILKVLGEEFEFDSLHWFSSATQYLKNRISQLESGIDASQSRVGLSGLQRWNQVAPPISNESQNAKLIIKQLQESLTESEIIQFGFSCARTFFH